MGGFGSGRRFGKKRTVEESLVLSVGDFYRRRRSKPSGTLTWTFGGGEQCSVGYRVAFGWPASVTLYYRCVDGDDVRMLVWLQTTSNNFSGERWWFTCPLIGGGVPCSRRAGKLFLPPGAKYFGCRKCHDLTYRSSQEAHRAERLFASIAAVEPRLAATIGRQR